MGLSLCGYDIKTQTFFKDLVNLGIGNFIYDRVDLEIRGKGRFQFKRFYNSQSKTCGVLGQGWTHSFEEKLLQDQGDGNIFMEMEQKNLFIRNRMERSSLP